MYFDYLGVGERIRSQHEEAVEEDKQKAIRCTEDVVRREETSRRERELNTAKGEWKNERQKLFQEAHQSQLRAIARQNAILEQKLRKEFAETLIEVQGQHREHVEEVTRKTWAEAEIVKQNAIDDTRKEEREIARQEAKKVAECVAEEKSIEAELAAKEKAQALEEQRIRLGQLHSESLGKQKRQLEAEFDEKLGKICDDYEARLSELQLNLDGQIAVNQTLERDLEDMTSLKNDWEEKYMALKQEFSNFIDQFPGFRGEFLLD